MTVSFVQFMYFVGFGDQWDPSLKGVHTESVDLLSIGLLLVISRIVDSWTVLCRTFAPSQLVDPEA